MSTVEDGPWNDEPTPQYAAPSLPAVTRSLLWITSILGVVGLLLVRYSPPVRAVYDVLALSPKLWNDWFPFVPVWQLVTYGFLHSIDSPMHLLFNMLGLYFFGSMLEGIVGPRRMLVLYLTSMALGGVAQLIACLATHSSTPTVGASGAILFLLVAMATMRPHQPILFFFIPLKLRTVALIYVGLDAFTLIEEIHGAGSGVAVIVHLTGAAFGFIAVKARWIWLDPISAWEARRAQKVVEDLEQDDARLDRLLQQIHDRGIGSLSAREREFLKRMSSRKSD